MDAILARLAAKAAEEGARKTAEAEIEPQSGPESARSDSPRGKGRVESAENAQEAPEVPAEKRSDPILPVVIERVEEARGVAAGRHPTAAPPQPPLPSVELGSGGTTPC